MYFNFVSICMALLFSSATTRFIRERRGVEWVDVSFRHGAVLHHHHDLLGDWIDLDTRDIEAARLSGCDGAGDVLLTEVGWPTNAWLWWLAHGGPPGHFMVGGRWVIDVLADVGQVLPPSLSRRGWGARYCSPGAVRLQIHVVRRM